MPAALTSGAKTFFSILLLIVNLRVQVLCLVRIALSIMSWFRKLIFIVRKRALVYKLV